jgi:hypothetical protein
MEDWIPLSPTVVNRHATRSYWGTRGFPDKYEGAETVVYGHWNNAVLNGDNGWPAPRIVGRTIGIDTISHGVLTAIRLPEQQVFQSARYETIWNPTSGT